MTDDREPFEQARAAGLAHAQVAEARESLIREFSGLIDADGYVADMPAWLRAFGERLLGLPILTPEEAEAETKALAETATRVGYELGRKGALAELRVVTSGMSYFALAYGPLYHTRESAAEALMKLRRTS